MPLVGYGVGTAWMKAGTSGDTVKCQALKGSVTAALGAGLTHIDDAEMYENTRVVGEAIREWLAGDPGDGPGGRSRSQLFITNKVYSLDGGTMLEKCDELPPKRPQLLQQSGLDYFDLLLIHAPCMRDGSRFQKSIMQAWAEMQEVVDKKRARSIGVSNFPIGDLREVLDACAAGGLAHRPACNQIESNLFFLQEDLVSFCHGNGMVVATYGGLLPIAKGFLDEDSEPSRRCRRAVDEAAAAHGRTAAQVLLRWGLQTGRVPITTSSRPERMREYADALNFELSGAEVAGITQAGAAAEQRRTYWAACGGYFEARGA